MSELFSLTALDMVYNVRMSAIATGFKDFYYAGETARLVVDAASAASVSVVFGNGKLELANDGGVWSGNIPTDTLSGRVNWTVFAKDAEGLTTAIAHGSFFVRCAGRSPLREVVEKIDEAMRTWGTNPNRSISVGEISISYKTLDELLAVRAQYVQRAEEQESGRALTGGLRVVEVCF